MPGRIYPDGMSPAAIKREQERQRAHDATAAATPIAQSKELGKSGALTAALKKYADPHAMLGDGKTPMTRAAVNEYADKLVILAPRLVPPRLRPRRPGLPPLPHNHRSRRRPYRRSGRGL